MTTAGKKIGGLLAMAMAVASVGLVAGCDVAGVLGCGPGSEEQQFPVCETAGQATVTGPDGFAPSTPPAITLGRSCLSAQGCTESPSFYLSTGSPTQAAARDDIWVSFQLPGPPAPSHFDLPTQEWVSVSGLRGPNYQKLKPVAGTIDVKLSNVSGEIVVFDVTLAPEEGSPQIRVAGEADIMDCHLESQCPF